MAAPPRISILANTIPNPEDRAAVDAAIKRVLADRTGDWRVSIVEPQNASYWQLAVEGPANFSWVHRFDGPGEQDPQNIERQLRAAVDAKLPTFSEITGRLDEKWTKPNTCPICGISEWSVSEIPYVLQQMGGKNAMPLYPVSCTNCGFTILFNAIVTGLFRDK